jgi:hypothetical protein
MQACFDDNVAPFVSDLHYCYRYCYSYCYCHYSTAEDTRLAELILYTALRSDHNDAHRAALLALQKLPVEVRTEIIAGCHAFAEVSKDTTTTQVVKLQYIRNGAELKGGRDSDDGDELDYEMSRPWHADLLQYLEQPAEGRLYCSLLLCAAALYDSSEASRLLELLLLPALKTDTELSNSIAKQQRTYLQQALCVAIATAHTAGAAPSLMLLNALREQQSGLSPMYLMTVSNGDATRGLLKHLHAGHSLLQLSAEQQQSSQLNIITCACNLATHTLM